jgi:hypothetical protein
VPEYRDLVVCPGGHLSTDKAASGAIVMGLQPALHRQEHDLVGMIEQLQSGTPYGAVSIF